MRSMKRVLKSFSVVFISAVISSVSAFVSAILFSTLVSLRSS